MIGAAKGADQVARGNDAVDGEVRVIVTRQEKGQRGVRRQARAASVAHTALVKDGEERP